MRSRSSSSRRAPAGRFAPTLRATPPYTKPFHPQIRLRSALSAPFVAALFYSFVEYARPQEKYDIVAGLPLGQVSLAALILSVLLFSKGLSWGGAQGKFLLAFLAWALTCALLARSQGAALDAYIETLKIVTVYFLLVASIRNRPQLYLFIAWLLLIYFYHTNFSLRSWALSGFAGLPKGTYVGSGFVRNPNDYGAWICSFWGVSLVLALRDRHQLWGRIDLRWIYWVSTVLMVLGVLISSSRGSAVGLAAGVAYLILIHVRSVKAKIGGATVAAVGILAFMTLLSEGQAARFETMGSAEDASAQDRIRTWRVAREVALDHPMTGVGIGRFLPIARQYAPGEVIFVQHNITLQALTDTGVPGLALMVALVIAFFRQQRRIKKRASHAGDPFLEGLSIGVTVSMVSFLVNGQFITVLFYPFMWFLLAVGGILHNLNLQEAGPHRPRVFGPRRLARHS